MRARLIPVLLLALAGLVPSRAGARAIHNFCAAARQHVAGDDRLAEAVRQVFGEPRYVAPSEQDAACIYPLTVLRYASADVLLTIGNVPGAACHGCAASLSAYVLARQDGGLKLVDRAIDFAQSGTFGSPGDLSAVRIGRDDGIAIESGGTFQGHSATTLDFYAFHAGHVVHVAASPPVGLSASDAGAVVDGPVTDVSGSWTISPGASDTLRVDYKVSIGRRRSRTTAVWRLVGERWVLASGAPPAALTSGQ